VSGESGPDPARPGRDPVHRRRHERIAGAQVESSDDVIRLRVDARDRPVDASGYPDRIGADGEVDGRRDADRGVHLPGLRVDARDGSTLRIGHPDRVVPGDDRYRTGADLDRIDEPQCLGVDDRNRSGLGERRGAVAAGHDECCSPGDDSEADDNGGEDDAPWAPAQPLRRPEPREPGVELGILSEDRLLELTQPRGGLDAELVDERSPSLVVDVKGLGLASGPVQGEHQLAAWPLAQRLALDEGLELRHERSVLAERKVGVDSFFERLDAQLLEPSRFGARGGGFLGTGERLASPELQRRTQRSGRPPDLAGGERLAPFEEEPLEPSRVERLALHAEHIPGSARDEDLPGRAGGAAGLEGLAKL
jgi:hypothetical protein